MFLAADSSSAFKKQSEATVVLDKTHQNEKLIEPAVDELCEETTGSQLDLSDACSVRFDFEE